MSDEVNMSPEETRWIVPEIPASDPKYIKHIRCDGARFHVLSWSTLGRHCSHPRCVVNKKETENA
jgi:hypothetical protein